MIADIYADLRLRTATNKLTAEIFMTQSWYLERGTIYDIARKPTMWGLNVSLLRSCIKSVRQLVNELSISCA